MYFCFWRRSRAPSHFQDFVSTHDLRRNKKVHATYSGRKQTSDLRPTQGQGLLTDSEFRNFFSFASICPAKTQFVGGHGRGKWFMNGEHVRLEIAPRAWPLQPVSLRFVAEVVVSPLAVLAEGAPWGTHRYDWTQPWAKGPGMHWRRGGGMGLGGRGGGVGRPPPLPPMVPPAPAQRKVVQAYTLLRRTCGSKIVNRALLSASNIGRGGGAGGGGGTAPPPAVVSRSHT